MDNDENAEFNSTWWDEDNDDAFGYESSDDPADFLNEDAGFEMGLGLE